MVYLLGAAGGGDGGVAVLCGNCGTDNPEAARVCRACAQLLDGPVANVPALPDSPYARRSRQLTVLIVAGTIGLLLFFCVILATSMIPPRSGRSGGGASPASDRVVSGALLSEAPPAPIIEPG